MFRVLGFSASRTSWLWVGVTCVFWRSSHICSCYSKHRCPSSCLTNAEDVSRWNPELWLEIEICSDKVGFPWKRSIIVCCLLSCGKAVGSPRQGKVSTPAFTILSDFFFLFPLQCLGKNSKATFSEGDVCLQGQQMKVKWNNCIWKLLWMHERDIYIMHVSC